MHKQPPPNPPLIAAVKNDAANIAKQIAWRKQRAHAIAATQHPNAMRPTSEEKCKAAAKRSARAEQWQACAAAPA